VKVVKTDFIQDYWNGDKRDLSIELDSSLNTSMDKWEFTVKEQGRG
jgi:hypothetical protein